MKFLLIVCVALTTAAFADSTSTTVKKDVKSTSDTYREGSMKADGTMNDAKSEIKESSDKTKQKMEDGMEETSSDIKKTTTEEVEE